MHSLTQAHRPCGPVRFWVSCTPELALLRTLNVALGSLLFYLGTPPGPTALQDLRSVTKMLLGGDERGVCHCLPGLL